MAVQISELANSHSQGFGGSDAQHWLSAGRNGVLSVTAKERIKDVKWHRISTFNANTDAQKAGHDFEDKIGNIYPHFEKEKKLSKVLRKTFKFETYAHADFFNEGNVYECKFVQKDIERVLKQYQAQLQWYYMLGADNVYIIHGKGGIDEGIATIEDINIVKVPQDKILQKEILQGLKIAQEYYDKLPGNEFEEISKDAELDNLCEEVGNLQGALNDIESQIKEKKEKIFQLMKEKEIDKISTENCNITYLCGGVRKTFDSTKFKKDHPDIYNEYIKETLATDTIRISINN